MPANSRWGFNSGFKGLTSALDVGGRSRLLHGRFRTWKASGLVWEFGWPPGPFWIGEENFDPQALVSWTVADRSVLLY